MAKANVLMRRIRAYQRSIAEADLYHDTGTHPRHQKKRDGAVQLRAKLDEVEKELAGFLALRTKGPWAAYAKRSE